MDLAEFAHLLATTEDRPPRMARVLYLDDQGDPAGFADVVGDPATVLDRLDAEGADGLAVQVWALDGSVQVPAAIVVNRAGRWAAAVAGDVEAVLADRAPVADDPPVMASCWSLIVHALAALDRSDAIPEPPDDPHPAAYLAAAWLGQQLAAADLGGKAASDPPGSAGPALTDLELPDEVGLVAALGMGIDHGGGSDRGPDLGRCGDGVPLAGPGDGLVGWDAVHAAVVEARPDEARRLGRNGVAWHANDLLGDPGRVLGTLAAAGHVDTADRIFATMIERAWVRPIA